MKDKNCLSEQDLILHYYGELTAISEQFRHLDECPLCAKRFAALSNDLRKLPTMAHEADFASGTRMVARVNEQLRRRRKSWLPALGASAAAGLALVVTISIWTPQTELAQTAQLTKSSITTMSLNEDMPDIDFLDELELLQELELLSLIEGV
jgi:predicted anti-sigma-YlaC factor YlaD